ncbi:uncharacterized protein K460DRAFT_356027 [Cucurbitaria berberidis CBS 394.84]|uniref:Uncharacterized protein n=1 Tax=Cucurbitaria berberidis CBS 394.84 TaxID=1168544 RepID=A0A9P4L8Q1_9PLEO|nr:uncharacterized protein K460DRAFT_356027 [Cucurbitaria berberidis CBS 394.84]KAF1846336.1 hypothetical protein K460DRAFT_356027 [Cucurbitaria berberidis CBS 394.84]
MDQPQQDGKPLRAPPLNDTPVDKTEGRNVTRSAPFTLPLPLNTHNVVTNAHIHDLQLFSKDLSAAVQAVWATRHESRYSDVKVLILSWEDDDLGVYREIEDLKRTFCDLFHYEVTEWWIPQHKPERKLNLEVGKFLERYDSKDRLLIVYYAGHGFLNEQRVPMWAANRGPSSPTLPSNSIQSQLEEADSDVLLLLDCCHAAHPTLTDSDHGVTEAIAACGFETTASGVGPHSFTDALIRELEIASQGPPIAVAKLHGRILWRLKTWKPSLQRDRDGNLWQNEDGTIPTEAEQRVTAVHCFLTNETIYRSIMLAPLKSGLNLPSVSSPQTGSSPSSLASASGSTASHVGDESRSSSGKTTSSDLHEPDQAQVLVSISIDSNEIENNPSENVRIYTEILRLLPASATRIKVEGFYGSFSKLVLISMPVCVWNMLPENPAYSFVGFVTTKNMMQDLQLASGTKYRDPTKR